MKLKLLLTFFTTIFILSFSLLFILHNSVQKEIVERFQAQQLFTTKQLAKELEVYLQNETQSVGKLASSTFLKSNNINQISATVQEYSENYKKEHIRSICVFNEKGSIIYSTLKEAVSLEHSDAQFYKWGRQKENKGEQFITTEVPLVFSPPGKESTFRVLIASPIYNESNSFGLISKSVQREKFPDRYVGLVVVVVDLGDILSSFFKSERVYNTKGSTWLLDNNGTLLYHPKHPEMLMFNLHRQDETCRECHDSFKYVETILAKTSGTTEYQLKDNQQKLSSFTSLSYKNISWKIVVNMPLDEVTSFVDSNLYQTLALFAVITLTLIGTAFYIFRSDRLKIRAEEETRQWQQKRVLDDAIRESEERYRQLVEISPDAIVVLCEGKIVYANSTALVLYGASIPNDLLGKNALDLVHPDDREMAGNQISEVLRTGQAAPMIEERLTRLDGSYLEVEVSSVVSTYLNKLAVQIVAHDITERKRTELEHQVIFEITQGITANTNLDELLKLIHDSLKKAIYAENCFVALHDQTTGLFSFPYFIDKFDQTPEPVTMEKSCTAYVFRTGKPLLLTQELFDGLVVQNEVELVGSNSPSWLGVPLRTPSRVIGVLVLQHYEEENVYSEGDIKFLEAVGSQIAVVIERKRVEEDLRNERLLLRTMIDHIPDSIYCKDTACRKTLANKTELHYSGAKTEAEILGKTDFDMYPKEIADGFFADDQLVIQTGHPVLDREEYVLDEKGQKQWLLTSKLPLKDEKGNITGIVGIGRNITKRKRAEEALTNERTLLRTIIDLIPDAIYVKDINGRKILANPKEVQISGKNSEDEVLGKTDAELFPERVEQQFQEEDQSVLQSGKSIVDIEGKLLDKNRQVHWLLGSKVPLLDAQGNIIGIVGLNHDITDRKRSEEEITKSNEQLSRTIAEKDKFFSIIAHDLRSPFHGIMTLTEMMASGSEEFSKDELMEFSQNMHEQATNLFKLIENLLEWAQMQRGSITFTPQELGLSDMVTQSIDTIKLRAEQKGIIISNEVPGSVKVDADERMVNTVLRNLISNSVKFTKRDGKITVRAKTTDNNMVEICVSDSGVGMNEKNVNRLFKMNEKVGSKGTEGEPSTGLGLLLCKEFVEKHGGKIWAESQQNIGSTFCFTLPQANIKGNI
ncbi:MAG: PAS domain S-box protein [Ignavibacteriaceae bacterium]|nr:PAS domain S-box protein [Ignavibacteriaceae bacterium]